MDPFANQGERLPIQSNGIINNWAAIPATDAATCKRLGERASCMLVDYAAKYPERRITPPHPTICGADFALVHLHRRLDLRALESANDLDFLSEYIVIARHIDRNAGSWPTHVPLNFYDRSMLQTIQSLFTIKRRDVRNAKP